MGWGDTMKLPHVTWPTHANANTHSEIYKYTPSKGHYKDAKVTVTTQLIACWESATTVRCAVL